MWIAPENQQGIRFHTDDEIRGPGNHSDRGATAVSPATSTPSGQDVGPTGAIRKDTYFDRGQPSISGIFSPIRGSAPSSVTDPVLVPTRLGPMELSRVRYADGHEDDDSGSDDNHREAGQAATGRGENLLSGPSVLEQTDEDEQPRTNTIQVVQVNGEVDPIVLEENEYIPNTRGNVVPRSSKRKQAQPKRWVKK